ncbi:hypothetical protein V5O48_003799 [Marasmius crinis-equi]|uniref:Uncharacterized protein n=1 Tax=Marasmius crinis-equi TaxID=585013 RepID=A0ABR3FS38_9AGAR
MPGYAIDSPPTLIPQFRIPSVSSTSLPTSVGTVDFADLQIVCKGRDLLDLLTQAVATNTRYAKGHEALDSAVLRFLKGTLPGEVTAQSTSLFATHGYAMPDFSNIEQYRGLRYKYLHLRWEPDRGAETPKRPTSLGIVPCFRTQHSLIADSSLSFGTPIIGDGTSFKRAILLQPMKRAGQWQYILAQTEHKTKPIYIRVPVSKVVPYWPYMHSPHLLLLAEIAPFVTGLTGPGLDNIMKAADNCYRPSISVQVEHQEDVTANTTVHSWPGYPVLADRRQLGDWMLRRSAPADSIPVLSISPTIPVPDHWCEPKSEPPTDDFQLLSLNPTECLRYRGHILPHEGIPFPLSPTSTMYPLSFRNDASKSSCTDLSTPPVVETPSSSDGKTSTTNFIPPAPETLLPLRNSKSLLSLRPITERLRKFSVGRLKESKKKAPQKPISSEKT